MKAILALAMLVALTLAAAAEEKSDRSANYFLPACRAVVNHQTVGTANTALQMGVCMGIVLTLRDMTCFPPGVTVSQATAVVVHWLDQRPERWHEDFISLAEAAMRDTWRCPK